MSGEYTTASEDEGETDTQPSTAEQSPTPYLHHQQTTDSEARRLSQKVQADMDQDLQRVLAKAKDLQVQH